MRAQPLREATLIAGGGDGTVSILTSHDQKAFQIVPLAAVRNTRLPV